MINVLKISLTKPELLTTAIKGEVCSAEIIFTPLDVRENCFSFNHTLVTRNYDANCTSCRHQGRRAGRRRGVKGQEERRRNLRVAGDLHERREGGT